MLSAEFGERIERIGLRKKRVPTVQYSFTEDDIGLLSMILTSRAYLQTENLNKKTMGELGGAKSVIINDLSHYKKARMIRTSVEGTSRMIIEEDADPESRPSTIGASIIWAARTFDTPQASAELLPRYQHLRSQGQAIRLIDSNFDTAYVHYLKKPIQHNLPLKREAELFMQIGETAKLWLPQVEALATIE